MGGRRVVFLYPKKHEFAVAARAMKIRGLLDFGRDPIRGKFSYLGWYADIKEFDAPTYGKYAMLVRDFYARDLQDSFNEIFPHLDHKSVPSSVHNPNAYMEAARPRVEALIEKYRLTSSPLEFYGSKHMAEGIVLLMDGMAHKELKGFLLADEQGMAKTIQSIIAALEFGKQHILVVAPKTPRIATWPTELRKVDKNAKIFLANYQWLGNGAATWTLITWDDLRRMRGMEAIYEEIRLGNLHGIVPMDVQEEAKKARAEVRAYATLFDLLIADEIQRAKHPSSQRSVALKALADQIPDIIELTGTPITKRPKDIVHPLQLIHHPIVREPKKFLARYYVPRTSELGEKEQISPQRLIELNELLRDGCIRREKSQTNLPPKVRYVERIELPPEVLAGLEKKWKDYCEEKKKEMEKPTYPVALVKRGKYREWTALYKVPFVLDWAEDLLESGEKVVVFTQFEEVFQEYLKKFVKYGVVGINGASTTEHRRSAQERFQKDPSIRVFVGNVQAAGVGIDLWASAYLGFNDLAWLPSDTLQAEDRICRGGQTRPCAVHFFLANNDSDEKDFKDFVESKEVVQAITNRRDEQGNISDAEWRGDIAGTALDGRQSLTEGSKNDFSWEDAGMEVPETDHPETDWRAIARSRAFKARRSQVRHGMPLNGPALEMPKIADHEAAEILKKLVPVLTGWNHDFAKSVSDWMLASGRTNRRMSEKQRLKAIEIIARNRGKLPKEGIV